MSQYVVLDDAPELRLVLGHDGVILVVDKGVAVCRFAVFHGGEGRTSGSEGADGEVL